MVEQRDKFGMTSVTWVWVYRVAYMSELISANGIIAYRERRRSVTVTQISRLA